MHLAWVGPVHPIRTGQSDHGELLLPRLAESATADLFIEDYVPSNEVIRQGFQCFRFDRLAERSDQYDAVIYQVGNNPHLTYAARLSSSIPGVLDIHDLHTGTDLGPRVLLQSARGAIMHSRHQLQNVAGQGALPIVQIPLPKESLGLTLPAEGAALKLAVGLPSHIFLILTTGWATNPHKRLGVAVTALGALVRAGIDAHHVHAGEPDEHQRAELMNLAMQQGVPGRVHITGWLSDEAMAVHIRAADVCINLRYPTVGEVSATTLQCMGAGKPVLVTPVDSFSELPADACLFVPSGRGEAAAVQRHLLRLASSESRRLEIGRRAHAYVQSTHNPSSVAQQYLCFLSTLSQASGGKFGGRDGR